AGVAGLGAPDERRDARPAPELVRSNRFAAAPSAPTAVAGAARAHQPAVLEDRFEIAIDGRLLGAALTAGARMGAGSGIAVDHGGSGCSGRRAVVRFRTADERRSAEHQDAE